jgi:hypothetical protein
MRNHALDEAIRASGYRKAWIAEQLDVHPGTLTRWLADGFVPRRAQREALADLLGRPAAELWPHVLGHLTPRETEATSHAA